MQIVPEISGLKYAARSSAFDEAWDGAGDRPRPQYEQVLAALADVDLGELVAGVDHDLASRGATFRGAAGDKRFRVDPVPRLVAGDEWTLVERGIAQRTRALNAFLADVYGEQRIVAAGRVPERLLATAVHFEPWMREVPVPHGVYAGAVALDLVRCEDGHLHVLEDNVRTPSGYTYMLAARDVLDERLPDAVLGDGERRSIGDIVERLGDALRAAAPDGVDEPEIAMLSDGLENSAWWEHEAIARRLDLPIVTLGELELRGGRVHSRVDGRLRPIDVLYRRTDEDRLQDLTGRPTPYGELLLEPLRRGRLAVFNAFGAGVADDKLAHAYVEEMIDFYLGQEPILGSVRTFDLGHPAAIEEALDGLDELVIKERAGEGGYGVTIVAHASAAEREQVVSELRHRPQDFIAQRRVSLSTHPTVIDGRLEPRHVDLRPFALQSGDDVHVVAGGLTRVAFGAGALVVNSSQNGGGKDTWVMR